MNHVSKQLNKFKILRWVCWGIVVLTASVSVWANILHARPHWVAYIFAAAPPLIALGCWEQMSRIPIDRDSSKLRRWSRPSAIVLIFAGAAYLSYFHQKSAIMRYTDDVSSSKVLPLLIDGLMIVTSVSTFELNDRILRLDAIITGVTVQEMAKASKPEPVRQREPNGRERVSAVLAKNPTITVTELAKRAGVSEGYAYTLHKELRSELVTTSS